MSETITLNLRRNFEHGKKFEIEQENNRATSVTLEFRPGRMAVSMTNGVQRRETAFASASAGECTVEKRCTIRDGMTAAREIPVGGVWRRAVGSPDLLPHVIHSMWTVIPTRKSVRWQLHKPNVVNPNHAANPVGK